MKGFVRYKQKYVYKVLVNCLVKLGQEKVLLVFWFGLMLYVPGNSYGHKGTVSSPWARG